MTITDTISILALISGVTGTVLGILNFLRDRPSVEVYLQWDMSVTPGGGYDPNKLWAAITITNVGQRPIFVSHVALHLPKGSENSHLFIQNGIAGETLTEASPSKRYIFSQDGLEKHALQWQDITAQISDSRGKVWAPKKTTTNKTPSWAKTSNC